jgi:hypothetical protein
MGALPSTVRQRNSFRSVHTNPQFPNPLASAWYKSRVCGGEANASEAEKAADVRSSVQQQKRT